MGTAEGPVNRGCRITLLGLGILTLLGTSPLSAQEHSTATVTVDGEMQSFTVEQCNRLDHRGIILVHMTTTAETGSLLSRFQEEVY